MLSSAISVLAIVATTLLATPAQASAANFTLHTRTTATTVRATCQNVNGYAYGRYYNFGCLCLDDLDDFCNNNGVSDYWQSLIAQYISANGKTFSYPSNAQPTCDGVGGFNCGSLSKVNNQCVTSSGSTNTPCDATKCFSNGGCCPRGQTYKNGFCCGTTGCNHGTSSCTPVTTCSTYTSNGICCPSGTSGWTGYKTRCCPSGQTEQSDGTCGCPSGQKVDPSNSSKCTTACPSGTKWGTYKCCPTDSTEKNGVCDCNDDNEDLSADGLTCSTRCTNSWKWCSKAKICCPPGSDEDAKGNCVCTDPQTTLNAAKNACVDRCPNGNFYQTTCCPNGATEKNGNGVCVCTDSASVFQGTNLNGQCVSKCQKAYWSNNDSGDICCSAGTVFTNPATCSCYDTTLTMTGNVITGYKCASKCPSGFTNGALGTCCPPGSSETAKGVCTCADPSKVISTDKTKCVDQCNTAQGWTYGPKKDQCCPPNSIEGADGVCTCTDPGSEIKNGACSNKCDTTNGWKWCQGSTPKCCPANSSLKGTDCVCDDPQQSLQNNVCKPRCASPQQWRTTKCCPADASEQGGICKCNDPTKEPSSDGNTCQTRCSSGQSFKTTKCCNTYLVEKSGQCVCPTSGNIDTGVSCIPACPNGQVYDSTTTPKGCRNICADGFTYKMGWQNTGLCCNNNDSPCNTTCCPAPKVEVGNSGVCCSPGATLSPTKQCIEPSPGVKTRKRENGQKIQLSPKIKSSSSSYGIEGNRSGKLCPMGMAACPIPGKSGENEYECLDTQSDLQSCGGCASLGTGVDCTAIPGARWMGCNVGKCEVYSCKAGWKKVGDQCERR